MTAASKTGSLSKSHGRGHSVRRTPFPLREAGALAEELGKCRREGRRGMGPGAYARDAEIMSGRTIAQQGLVTTCKDSALNGTTGGAERVMVWRMSLYERGCGSNVPRSGPRGRSGRDNAPVGHKGLWVLGGQKRPSHPDIELALIGGRVWRRSDANFSAAGPRAHQRRNITPSRKARSDKCVQSRDQNRTREIRPSGIAGRLQETAPMEELGTHPATERAVVETLLLRAHAPDFYPDICTPGSVRGAARKGRPYRNSGRVQRPRR